MELSRYSLTNQINMRKFFYGLWLVIAAWLILFLLAAVAVSIVALVSLISPTIGSALDVVTWLVIPIAVAVWVVNDAQYFREQGIDTSPAAWGWGVFLLTIVFFPLYIIRRKITWSRKLSYPDWK